MGDMGDKGDKGDSIGDLTPEELQILKHILYLIILELYHGAWQASFTDPREDLTPELRVFSFYDKDAVALGHRLHNLSS